MDIRRSLRNIEVYFNDNKVKQHISCQKKVFWKLKKKKKVQILKKKYLDLNIV